MFTRLDQALVPFIHCFKNDQVKSYLPVDSFLSDILLVIFKKLTFSELKEMSLVSKQWYEVTQHGDLQLKKTKAFIQSLRKYSDPFLTDNCAIEKPIIHHKGWFCRESFEINQKKYKKPKEKKEFSHWQDISAPRIFLVSKDLSSDLTEWTGNPHEQALFMLQRKIILLSTEGHFHSDFAYLPFKWKFYPSSQILGEEENNFVDKIRLEIEDLNRKINV